METTWIAIADSLFMGTGALLVFIWAVKAQHFKNFEDVKYQVFWSDPEDKAGQPQRQAKAANDLKAIKGAGNGVKAG